MKINKICLVVTLVVCNQIAAHSHNIRNFACYPVEVWWMTDVYASKDTQGPVNEKGSFVMPPRCQPNWINQTWSSQGKIILVKLKKAGTQQHGLYWGMWKNKSDVMYDIRRNLHFGRGLRIEILIEPNYQNSANIDWDRNSQSLEIIDFGGEPALRTWSQDPDPCGDPKQRCPEDQKK